MKKRLFALALICGLLLTLPGCAAMLNREYSFSTPHTDYPVSDKSAVLQVENYQGLVNAILYFVTEHKDTGIVHLTYAQDEARVDSELEAACREVCGEDPLGAYAVEDIQYVSQRMSAYFEVTASITYAHSEEEVSAITPVAGSSAIRQTVSAAMTAFADRCVFRVSYFTGDVLSLRQLVRQTWLDTPLALAGPQTDITLYPNSGTSRIVEIALIWPQDAAALAEQSMRLEQRALELLEQANLSPESLTPEVLLNILKRAAVYDPEGESTAYAVLVDGAGNALGFAQALRLLCQLTDLEATVVEGRLDGESQFWLIVNTPDGYRHLAPTLSQPVYATDDEFTEAGYVWEISRYPACVEYTPASDPEGPENPEGPESSEDPEGSENSEDPENPKNAEDPENPDASESPQSDEEEAGETQTPEAEASGKARIGG